mgnify:CR=1 FL=1
MESTGLSVVVAFIQPFQLERVIDALRHAEHCPGVSVTEVRGMGSTRAHPPRRGERTEVVPLEQAVRLEIFCASVDAVPLADVIRTHAHTGHAGDGKVFVCPVTDAARIRTGAHGADALHP